MQTETMLKYAAELKTAVEQKKEQEDELKKLGELEKFGPCETWWTTALMDAGIRSEVYHGGDWAGDACRKFLGVQHASTIDPAKTHKGLLEDMRKKIDQTDEILIDNRVKKADLRNFVSVLALLCPKLATAHKFYASIQPVKDTDELARGIAACKDYVQFYRENLCGEGCQLKVLVATGKAKQIKPKHHVLETHVPIFALEWRCVGRFAEDVVESVHRVVNKLTDGMTNLSNMPLRLMQAVDDKFNLLFEQAAKKSKPKPKK